MFPLIQISGCRGDYAGPILRHLGASMEARRADIEAVRGDY